MSKDVLTLDYTFVGKHRPPANGATAHGPFVKADTSAAGSPTVQSNDGLMELALDNTNEVQNICLYWGDELGLAIDKLIAIDIWAKITASVPAAVTASFGLASARNDAITSMAEYLLFQLGGDNDVKVLADDGANVLAAAAVGDTLSTTIKRFQFDFASGIKTQAAPSLSVGGKANVKCAVEKIVGSQQLLRPVLPNTSIDLSNYAGGLQFFAQLQKTAATSVATLSFERIRIQLRQG